jgi:hypothetical protein
MTSCNHKIIEKDWFDSNIDKFGLSVITVESTSYCPSFAYSIGLWKTYNHPEIICFGLTKKILHNIINDIAELIKHGDKINTKQTYYNIFKDSRAEFLEVDKRNINDYFGYAIEYHNTNDFPALQLIWTDRKDRFPWESEFEQEFIYKQPLLDRNADFKFRELKNLGIFTTKQWLDLKSPILNVVHDSDGDWQFLTGDQMPEDIRLVCLDEIIKSDMTLNDLFDLDYGECAVREKVGDKWIRNKMEQEE